MKTAGVARVTGKSKYSIWSHLQKGEVNPKAYVKTGKGIGSRYEFNGRAVRALHRANQLIMKRDEDLSLLRYREPGIQTIPRAELQVMAKQIVDAVKESPYVRKQQEEVVKHVLKSIASVL